MLLAAASVPLGFGAALWGGRGRTAPARAWLWRPLAAGLLPLAAAAPRLGVQASFEELHGFGQQPVLGGPLGYLLAWVATGVGGAAWLARRCLLYLALGAGEGR